MGFAAGLAAGMGAVERGIAISEAAEKKRNRKLIAAELTKDYGTEEEEIVAPSQPKVDARVQQGQMEAAAVQGLAPDAAPAPAPAAPAKGLMLKGQAPYKDPKAAEAMAGLENVTSGNVIATAAEGAKVTPEQAKAEMAQVRKVRVENPMQQYLRYQGAALKAAELGDLDLNKAYTDMATAAYKTDLTRAASTALGALKAGDAKPLERLMSSDFVPNGYQYKNMKVLPDGSVETDIVGAEGKTTKTVIEQSELLSMAALATNPEFLGKMAEADIKTRADRAQAQQKLASDVFLKKLGFEYDTKLEGMRQAGQDRRKAADLAIDRAKLDIQRLNASTEAWYKGASIKLRKEAQGQAEFGRAVKDLDPDQQLVANALFKEGTEPRLAAAIAAKGIDNFKPTFDPRYGTGFNYAGVGGSFVNTNPYAIIDASVAAGDERSQMKLDIANGIRSAVGEKAFSVLLKIQDNDTLRDELANLRIQIPPDQFRQYGAVAQSGASFGAKPAPAEGRGFFNSILPTPQQVQEDLAAKRAQPPEQPKPRTTGLNIGAGPLGGARLLDYQK